MLAKNRPLLLVTRANRTYPKGGGIVKGLEFERVVIELLIRRNTGRSFTDCRQIFF